MSDIELENGLDLPPVPTVERYKEAFCAIEVEMSDNQRHMLRTQYYAPNHAVTMRELAKA